MRVSPWTKTVEKKLKKLWGEGHSCAEIARMLGGVSRNAVIGKAARLGLEKRLGNATSSRMGGKKAQAILRQKAAVNPKPSAPTKPVPVVMGPEPVVPLHERRGVDTVRADQCRWPIGHPGTPNFHFCSYRKVQGKSYCLHHLLRSLPEWQRVAVAARYSAPSVGADEAATASPELESVL